MTLRSPLSVEEQVARSRERQRLYQPRYYATHREMYRANSRRYYYEHRDERAEYHYIWNALHPHLLKHYRDKRRARIYNANGRFTRREFELKCIEFGHRCAYCDKHLPLVPDHIIPLSRGGSDSIKNIAPACIACNQSKSSLTAKEFLERSRHVA